MATGLQPGNRRHRHDHMVLQTRLSGKEPGVPWDVQKVQGMGGCGESRKSLHKGHGIPGQSEPERLRKGRLDGAQRTAQTKKITAEAPGKRMPGALATAQQDKVCRVLPERTGGRRESLYHLFYSRMNRFLQRPGWALWGASIPVISVTVGSREREYQQKVKASRRAPGCGIPTPERREPCVERVTWR